MIQIGYKYAFFLSRKSLQKNRLEVGRIWIPQVVSKFLMLLAALESHLYSSPQRIVVWESGNEETRCYSAEFSV